MRSRMRPVPVNFTYEARMPEECRAEASEDAQVVLPTSISEPVTRMMGAQGMPSSSTGHRVSGMTGR